MKKQISNLPQTSPSQRLSNIDDIDNMTTNTEPAKVYVDQEDNGEFIKQMKKKARRPSFIQLEADKQIMLDKMIRQEMKKQGKLSRKMSLEDDETCLCASDIYSKADSHWKNRQISQLTTKKLDSIPIEQITKIKLLNQQPMTGYNLLRITINQKQIRDFAIRTIDCASWFSSSLWICLVFAGYDMNMKRENQGQVQGYILKKSQFLGNWELRYVTISSKLGLVSSKKKGQTGSVKIKQTAELWSRLETIKHQQVTYVIIKTWHMMFKYQFALPILQVAKWAKAFSTLVK